MRPWGEVTSVDPANKLHHNHRRGGIAAESFGSPERRLRKGDGRLEQSWLSADSRPWSTACPSRNRTRRGRGVQDVLRGTEMLPATAIGSFGAACGFGAAACSGSAAADSPFDPVKDDPALPRVLLIGDSISIGYTVPVRQMLRGTANVHRIPENGQYSSYGLEHIDEWLGDGKWDVIHFNWGIWDTHFLDNSGGLITDADEPKFAGKSSIRTPHSEVPGESAQADRQVASARSEAHLGVHHPADMQGGRQGPRHRQVQRGCCGCHASGARRRK